MKKVLLAAILAGTALTASHALAQYDPNTRERNLEAKYSSAANIGTPRAVSVFQRPRGDFTPVRKRAGGYIFAPEIGLGLEYNDNIFADDSDEREDLITKVAPSLQILSDWNRHALNFFAAGEFAGYNDFENQDYSDYIAGIKGRYDIQRDFFVRTDFSYQNLHENRGLPNAQTTDNEPTELSVTTAKIGLTNKAFRFGYDVEAGLIGYDYFNINATNNDGRDRNDYIGSLKLSYEIVPEFDAYIKASANNRAYRTSRDSNNIERDSTGYSLVGGTDIDFSGVVTGDVYAGYAEQDYDFNTFDKVDVFVYGGSLLWTPTGLTSVSLTTDRSVEDSTLNNISSYIDTRYVLRVEHELLRNLLINASGQYRENEFEGVPGTTREDEIYGGGAGITFLISRNVAWNADYEYTDRDSNVDTQDYSRNIVKTSFDFKF